MQVPVNQVDFLLAAKALADVLRPDLADTVDGLQLAIRCGEQILEAAELGDDPLNDQPGQAWYAPKDAEAAWRDGIVEGVQLSIVAEQFGKPTEVQRS